MLGAKDPVATLAVRDLEAAKRFYEGKLKLKPADEQVEGAVSYKTGRSTLFVYPSEFAGTNQATAVTWPVGASELDALVKDLKARGVTFEHYDMPGTKVEGDVHVGDGMRVAWFKDPDGNIHALAARAT